MFRRTIVATVAGLALVLATGGAALAVDEVPAVEQAVVTAPEPVVVPEPEPVVVPEPEPVVVAVPEPVAVAVVKPLPPKPPEHIPTTICHKGETLVVDDDGALKGHLKHGDTLGACPVPFVAYTVTARWVLPATWDYATTPPGNVPGIWDQTPLTGDLGCNLWSQDDTYLIDSEADRVLFESLDDDGFLRNGEDSSIYQSHTFTQGPPCVVEPPTFVPTCTSVTGAEVIAHDGVLAVEGGWAEAQVAVPFSGTLADLGTVFDLNATQTQYLGIHIDTPEGTIVYEEDPSYGGTLWSKSAWAGVPATYYAAQGTIQEYVHLNGDVPVTGIRLVYTHPEASTTTVTSATVGCTIFTFVVEPPVEEPPVEEPPVEEPPVEEPPVVVVDTPVVVPTPTPTPTAVIADVDELDGEHRLASTGSEGALALASLATALAALGTWFVTRARSRRQG